MPTSSVAEAGPHPAPHWEASVKWAMSLPTRVLAVQQVPRWRLSPVTILLPWFSPGPPGTLTWLHHRPGGRERGHFSFMHSTLD